ncbi:hypothetical protein SAMN04487819_101418 [Actinopolyspora alba]|uniref:Uncharacterized protein n=1 Tax=Actinopolyspora alba TaxID=673379 RepID=A0A1I1U077_9ACTN|nr:hypothetical protein [Actinopolyspora alba]SFD63018.1 hypothetical protein SAMN04487819_101418 [Actinopolyspora alba]
MSDHDISDDDPERPGTAPAGPVVTAALLGFNLVMFARGLYRLSREDTFLDVAASSQPGLGELLIRGFLYGFIAAAAVGHLWFMTRVLRMCGVPRPVPTTLLSIAVSTVLVLPPGLVSSMWGSSADWLTRLLLLPSLAALGHAVVVRFALRGSLDSEAPRPTARTAVFTAEMLGINFVLIFWTLWMYYWLARFGIGMSSVQEPASLIVAIHCVLAVLALLEVWFLVRMMRFTGPARPALLLLPALVLSVALAALAGVGLWVLWQRWRVFSGYEVDIPLFALLAAASFGLVARGARRRRAV